MGQGIAKGGRGLMGKPDNSRFSGLADALLAYILYDQPMASLLNFNKKKKQYSTATHHGKIVCSIGFVLTGMHLTVLPATNGETRLCRYRRALRRLATSVTLVCGDAKTSASAALRHTLVKFRRVCRLGPLRDLPYHDIMRETF